jgi:hypothetical protein
MISKSGPIFQKNTSPLLYTFFKEICQVKRLNLFLVQILESSHNIKPQVAAGYKWLQATSGRRPQY